jgi:hypothetical protein
MSWASFFRIQFCSIIKYGSEQQYFSTNFKQSQCPERLVDVLKDNMDINKDELMLLFSFIAYWIVLAALTFVSNKKIKTVLINLFIHIVYSCYFLYGLFYKTQGGTSLAWFLYLLFILWLHTAINLGQFIYKSIKTRSK